MNKTLFIFLLCFVSYSGGSSPAITDEGHKPYVGSKALERMKQLAGNWEGREILEKALNKQKSITD